MRERQDLLSIFFIPNQLPTTKDNSVKPLLNNGFSIFANRGTKIMPNYDTTRVISVGSRWQIWEAVLPARCNIFRGLSPQ